MEVTSLSPEDRFDAFDPVGTLAGLGRREPCSECQRIFLVSALLRSPEGAVCLACDLEREARARALSSRWDIAKFAISCALLSVSSIGAPWAAGVASVPRPGPLAFMASAVMLSLFSCLLIVATMRDLRFDLGARDPILLGKHMFTVAFAVVVNAVNAGVFAMVVVAALGL